MRDLKTDFCSTAANVRSRHELLLESIGVFKEEAEAYELVTMLSWALPTAVVLGGAVDSLCACLYMRYFHPWQEILFYEDDKSEEGSRGNSGTETGRAVETSSNVEVVDEKKPSEGKDHNYF